MVGRPLRTTLLFAAIGPLVAIALTLAVFAPAIANLGPFGPDAGFGVLFGGYVIGAPPLAATGFLVATAAGRGWRLPRLTLVAAILGFAFGGLSALFWFAFGPDTGDLNTALLMLLATIGATAAFATTILLGLLSRRRAAGSAR